MRRLIFGILFLFVSSMVVATDVSLSKDLSNSQVIVTDSGLGYKTTIHSDDGQIVVNVPSNVEIITTSVSPAITREKTSYFLVFTLYQGKQLVFDDTQDLEVVYRYPNGYGQYSTNLYNTIKELSS